MILPVADVKNLPRGSKAKKKARAKNGRARLTKKAADTSPRIVYREWPVINPHSLLVGMCKADQLRLVTLSCHA